MPYKEKKVQPKKAQPFLSFTRNSKLAMSDFCFRLLYSTSVAPHAHTFTCTHTKSTTTTKWPQRNLRVVNADMTTGEGLHHMGERTIQFQKKKKRSRTTTTQKKKNEYDCDGWARKSKRYGVYRDEEQCGI